MLEKNIGTSTFIFILLTFLSYNVHRVILKSSFFFFFQAKEHSFFFFYCICSFNDKKLETRLTSGLSQTTVNKESGSKNKVPPVNFKADIPWNTDHSSYYGLLCRMLSVPNIFKTLFCNYSIC